MIFLVAKRLKILIPFLIIFRAINIQGIRHDRFHFQMLVTLKENVSSKGLSVLIQSLVSLPPFLTNFLGIPNVGKSVLQIS